MAKFSSVPVTLGYPAERIFDRLSNLDNLKGMLERVPADRIPEDKKELFDHLEITPTSITIPGGPTGPIKLEIEEMVAPRLVKLVGRDTPVALTLYLRIDPIDADTCRAITELEIDIPPMLKPMVAGPLQKMVDQFSTVLTAVPFD